MGTEFVNVTVNTLNLYKTSTRDYATVGIVGVGGGSASEPKVIGSWNEADDEYADSALGKGVKLALINGASKVIAVDAGASTLTDIKTALAKLSSRDVQVVVLAGLSELADTAYISDALMNHVEGASIDRIGVFMLAKAENATTMPTAIGTMLTANHSKMFGIAHNSDNDVACATAGLIARLKPWESPLMKSLTGVVQTSGFTTTQLAGLATAQINPLVTPTYVTGSAYVIGSAYTFGSSVSGMTYIDTRRVVNDISYKVKAGLTNPNIIGQAQITKPGLAIVLNKLAGILSNSVLIGEIDSYAIDCPVINALAKPVNARSAGDTELITTARTSRTIQVVTTIVYSGVLHMINVDVTMTV